MAADTITLVTKSPYSDKGVKWISSGDGSYEIEEIDAEKRGTSITLSIKSGEDYDSFLEEWKIKDLVKKYSDYVRYPIYFNDEVINSTKPIWKTDKSTLKDEDYNEFYKSNFHDWEDPMMHFHLKVQGNIEYTSLLYIPKKLLWISTQKTIKKDCSFILKMYLSWINVMN